MKWPSRRSPADQVGWPSVHPRRSRRKRSSMCVVAWNPLTSSPNQFKRPWMKISEHPVESRQVTGRMRFLNTGPSRAGMDGSPIPLRVAFGMNGCPHSDWMRSLGFGALGNICPAMTSCPMKSRRIRINRGSSIDPLKACSIPSGWLVDSHFLPPFDKAVVQRMIMHRTEGHMGCQI